MGRSTAGDAGSPGAPGPGPVGATEFWTIEVENRGVEQATGAAVTPTTGTAISVPGYSAQRWKDAHGEALIEAAITHGAKEWNWTFREWGVVLELGFADEADWLRFRATPAVSAALDAVPDPVNGLYVYPGRGGASGARVPTRPRPRPLAGGAVPDDPEPVALGRPLGRYTSRPGAADMSASEFAVPDARP